MNKLEEARAALAQAEQAVGLVGAKNIVQGAPPVGETGKLRLSTGDSLGVRGSGITQGSSALALVEEAQPAPVSPDWGTQTGTWEVSGPLHQLFPYGLVKGTTYGVGGSQLASLLVAGIASAQGAWTACIGMPNLGWATAVAAGVVVEQTVRICPANNASIFQVISAAIDGFDAVVVGKEVHVAPREQKILAKRARSRGAIIVGESWAVREHIDAVCTKIRGLEQGAGHVSAVDFKLHRKGAQPCFISVEAQGITAANPQQPARLRLAPLGAAS